MTPKTDTHPRRVASYMNSGLSPTNHLNLYVHGPICMFIELAVFSFTLLYAFRNYAPRNLTINQGYTNL